MLRQDFWMPLALGELLRREDRFLSLFCVFVDIHVLTLATPLSP
jgi:hypothetical protein